MSFVDTVGRIYISGNVVFHPLNFPFNKSTSLPSSSAAFSSQHPSVTTTLTTDPSLIFPSPSTLSSPREPKSVKQALQDPVWITSMQAEFHALQEAKTWTLVLDPNMNIVSNKWVSSCKIEG